MLDELKQLKQDIIEDKMTLYCYITNNYYRLDKEILKEFIINLDYNIKDYKSIKEIEIDAIENTIERLF